MKALVTGGNGFLGFAIVRALLSRGVQVRTLHRRDDARLRGLGVEVCPGDLADRDVVRDAVAGCEVVFHVAARVGVWGRYEEYYRSNVLGTEHVVNACRREGVRVLVHTSTPSVVFCGRDQENINESQPFPERFYNAYQSTKAAAERCVLTANGADLKTLALRPHLIWGEGDPHLVKRVVERARANRLLLVNGCQKIVDATYIDNAVQAHLLAADCLRKVAPACAGKAYFIANGEPVPMVELLNGIVRAAGLSPVGRSIPAYLAHVLALLMELACRLGVGGREPLLTRFVVSQLTTAHWYDMRAAYRDLGYRATVSTDEGLQRLQRFLRSAPG